MKQWLIDRFGEIKGAFKKYGAENGSLIAGAISFYAFLTILPLLLLGVATLGFIVGGSDKAFNDVVGLLHGFVPTSTFIEGTLRGLVSARGGITLIGIISLLWTGSQFFVTLMTALDDVWEVTDKPGYIKARIKGIIMLVVFGVLLLVSIASTAMENILQHPNITGGFATTALADLLSVVAVGVATVFSILMFLVLYKWLPNREVRWSSALYGAVFAGVTWEIAKELYRLYVEHLANFNKLYGSLGSVIILILWIYYSSLITVVGAEIAYVNEHGAQDQPEEAERLQKAS